MFLLVLFFLAALSSAQDLDSAARELARKVRQDVASLTVRNASSLAAAEVADIARTLETELRVQAGRPGVAVNVTLSENVQTYLWVAEIRRGEEREVAMLSVARPAAASAAPVTIEKKLLWEQDKPILDAAMAGSFLMILDTTGVSFYRQRMLTHSLLLSTAKPLPRDPRGRLVTDRDSFRAFLPGIVCNGSVTTPPAMSCGESNGPWPFDGINAELPAGRNYFTAPRVGMFFSIAALPKFQIVAGVDGRTRIYDGGMVEASAEPGWGSDIVAVDTGCRSGRQVLASRSGDSGELDAIQAYEVTGRGAVAASEPTTFPGPVVALWPSGQKGETVAIARNLETGRYAAYSLAITCDR